MHAIRSEFRWVPMKTVPPDDEGPRVSGPGELSRDELIGLVERVQRAQGTESELAAMIRRFEQSVVRPGASDLIFWPKRRADGSFDEMTAAEIVDTALAYRAIELGP